jgi:hypothetical protein
VEHVSSLQNDLALVLADATATSGVTAFVVNQFRKKRQKSEERSDPA